MERCYGELSKYLAAVEYSPSFSSFFSQIHSCKKSKHPHTLEHYLHPITFSESFAQLTVGGREAKRRNSDRNIAENPRVKAETETEKKTKTSVYDKRSQHRSFREALP
jgi:hypothetical protein